MLLNTAFTKVMISICLSCHSGPSKSFGFTTSLGWTPVPSLWLHPCRSPPQKNPELVCVKAKKSLRYRKNTKNIFKNLHEHKQQIQVPGRGPLQQASWTPSAGRRGPPVENHCCRLMDFLIFVLQTYFFTSCGEKKELLVRRYNRLWQRWRL